MKVVTPAVHFNKYGSLCHRAKRSSFFTPPKYNHFSAHFQHADGSVHRPAQVFLPPFCTALTANCSSPLPPTRATFTTAFHVRSTTFELGRASFVTCCAVMTSPPYTPINKLRITLRTAWLHPYSDLWRRM